MPPAIDQFTAGSWLLDVCAPVLLRNRNLQATRLFCQHPVSPDLEGLPNLGDLPHLVLSFYLILVSWVHCAESDKWWGCERGWGWWSAVGLVFLQAMHGWHMKTSGPRFNIKMLSYQYRKSHCGDKTVVRSSYLHNGISYTSKMSSLYWIGTQYMKILSIYWPFVRGIYQWIPLKRNQ